MRQKHWLEISVEVLLIVAVIGLLAGQFLGQPILVGFVNSDSMSPTLDSGDGYVALPAGLVGGVEEGDVVTYRAERLNGGGLVTHRIVGRTDRGFLTRGDANPTTDQATGEPMVKRPQIVAVALQVQSTVIRIPGLGTAVSGIRNVLDSIRDVVARWSDGRITDTVFSGIVVGLLLVAYFIDVIRSRSKRSRDRSRRTGTNSDNYVRLAVLGILLAGTASMVLPAGTIQYDVISAETDSDRPGVIPRGEAETETITIRNSGLIPVVVFLDADSDGITVAPDRIAVPGRGETAVSITLEAPQETGYYRRFLVTHRYLAILPQPALTTLYRIHPWLPIVIIDGLIGGGIYIFGRVVLGSGGQRPRDRSRERSSPVRRQMRRWLYRRDR